MEMRKLTGKAAILAATIAASATASARSLLYYYDFDTVENGALVYEGVNKGMVSNADLTLQQSGSLLPGYVADGAFGSDYALCQNSKTSLWLGDGTTSLGCGTTVGFTISFWIKPSTTHDQWSNFFGFRLGGVDYRFTYRTANTAEFCLYYNLVNSGAVNPTYHVNDATVRGISELQTGVWQHLAIVATPNGTNNVGTCALYVDGAKVANVVLDRAGDLQRIYLGRYVLAAPSTLSIPDFSTKNTCIDDLAVFDYPTTAEHVKWLSMHKPAQPTGGPGRAMPIAWKFDTNDSSAGILATNSGTDTNLAYRWTDNSYVNWSTDAALNTVKAFLFQKNQTRTWRVDGTGDNGLGASLGSGITLSFWMNASNHQDLAAWSCFLSFRIGDRYERFGWGNGFAAGFKVFGTNASTIENDPEINYIEPGTEWRNVCLVWDKSGEKLKLYLDGEETNHVIPMSGFDSNEALKLLAVGSRYLDNTGAAGTYIPIAGGLRIDEVAVFNYSLSPEQIAWLHTNIPSLPPLDTTNIVRTVSADCAWADGLASWNVREWSVGSDVWTATTRYTIYPSCEDTDVEASVAFSGNVTITNDTFVTPRVLAVSGSGTLECADGSLFAPKSLVLTAGAELSVPVAAVRNGRFAPEGIVFGTGARIVFDINGLADRNVILPLATNAIVLPDGESDVLAHFGTKGRPAMGGQGRLSLPSTGDGIVLRCVKGFMLIVR